MIGDVAELFIRYWLATFGLSTALDDDLAQRAGRSLLWFALMNCDGACEIRGASDAAKAFTRRFEGDGRTVMSVVGCSSVEKYLWTPDGAAFDLSADVDLALKGTVHVGMLLLDLEAAGTAVGDHAGKPLFSIAFDVDVGARLTRRLTHGYAGH